MSGKIFKNLDTRSYISIKLEWGGKQTVLGLKCQCAAKFRNHWHNETSETNVQIL